MTTMCERFLAGDKCMSRFKRQPVAVQSHRVFNPTKSVAMLTPGWTLAPLTGLGIDCRFTRAFGHPAPARRGRQTPSHRPSNGRPQGAPFSQCRADPKHSCKVGCTDIASFTGSYSTFGASPGASPRKPDQAAAGATDAAATYLERMRAVTRWAPAGAEEPGRRTVLWVMPCTRNVGCGRDVGEVSRRRPDAWCPGL